MKKILIYFLRTYQKFISPALGGHCRFYPSCSQYSVEAIGKHGIIKGSLFSFWRILRCNPWGKGGADRP